MPFTFLGPRGPFVLPSIGPSVPSCVQEFLLLLLLLSCHPKIELVRGYGGQDQGSISRTFLEQFALVQITPVLNTGLSLSEPLQLYKGYNAIYRQNLAILWHTLAYSGILLRTLAYSGIILHTLAYIGILWRTLAYSGILWHTLIYSGILWITLAYSGILWHTLAYFCILWHTMAYSGILWHTIAYSGILWHTLAYSGILWHTLAYP